MMGDNTSDSSLPNEQQANAAAAGAERKLDSNTQATVIVRGEAVGDDGAKPSISGSQRSDTAEAAAKKVSEEKLRLHVALPALIDDADVGIEKAQVVTRDSKADLAFVGTLLASAAPSTTPSGKWEELRVYVTSGGKHVFSRADRSIFAKDDDSHTAEIFDPTPSMPSQLLRSAKELTRSRPVEWTDAAADFFGYAPLAKMLYRKLSGRFEEHIT